ncbi:MAG: polysaccharide biosynthesis C-terminal domain-containing protein [Methanobrevibacter ruminantium]|uniref:oligosaccharide flippase family protein n=1 Tax=Methanobrevibacter ruminantium TaxID=83816 RepID=UPI0026E993BF|nr:polysaccharide biosynthesis C-terminal domain-containing protein [Methanobrevibacter ruminantium]MCI5737514.1 polysaccharide biosynthesis C-terminal domain-containing protein [Methanobrevibacter ruminantium]MDO5842238.1 polysaccharide biosynthesis C-terminal domain-containing protein [Methanobrevibacter ruminantium]
MSEYVRFIQRIGLVGLTNILISLSSLIFIPIITKSFTTAEYGMWAQVNTTIALVPNIANLGLPYTMVRFLSAEKDKEKIKDSFYPMISLTFISTLIICSLFLIFGNAIANALFNGSMQVLYITTAISFFACMNLMLISFFRTFQQMKRYSLFLVLQSYIGVFVSIYLTYAGYNIETVVLGLLTGYVAVFIMMAFLIVKYLGIGIGKWSNLKEQLAFALPTIPSNVSSWVVDSSDKYVIGILIGSVAVGCYSPGYALGSILLMFLSPFAVLLPAVLPEHYEKGDMSEVDKYLSYSMKYYLLLTIPAAVGMSVLSKPLLYIITTPEIALGGYMVTPFVCLGAIFMGMYGITNNILILEKNTMILGKLWIVVAISNIVLNLLLVPYLNILGAAIATLICYILAFAVTAIASKKTMRLPFNIKELLKIVIAASIMGIAVYIMHPIGIINVLISIVAGVIIYFAIIFILKAVTMKEIAIFKDLIH